MRSELLTVVWLRELNVVYMYNTDRVTSRMVVDCWLHKMRSFGVTHFVTNKIQGLVGFILPPVMEPPKIVPDPE